MKKRIHYYLTRLLIRLLGRNVFCKKSGALIGKMFAYIDSKGNVVLLGLDRQCVYVDFETPNSLGFTLTDSDVSHQDNPRRHHAS